MPAKIATLCDAVKDFLNGQSYTETFTATRSNAPVNQLEDTEEIIVTVFPGDYLVDIESRDTWRRTYSVFVAVQKCVDGQVEEDAMLLLTEEIEASLENQNMDDFAMISLVGTLGARTPLDADQIRGAGQFVSVIEVSYVG